MSYAWSETVEEWFINEERGLEHGLTLSERPPGAKAEDVRGLGLAFEVRGGLRPVVCSSGRDVAFLDASGEVVLNYSGLKVFDTNDRTCEATFSAQGTRLSLRIDESEAVSPLTIDPIAQQAFIKASNADPRDFFGSRVAIDGDTLVVAAFGGASGATVVEGNQNDNGAPFAGAA